MTVSIKNPAEIAIMRKSGKILATILKAIKQEIKEGISTEDLNQIALQICAENNAHPSFLGYGGFPAAICASINHEIVHGIPKANCKLKNGDIVSIDCGVYYQGFHTDACFTVVLGTATEKQKLLLNTTKEALSNAIAIARDGVKLGDISNIIQLTAEKKSLNVVKNLTGHGIGKYLHEEPQILNYGKKDSGITLKEGMTLAIEPIFTLGSPQNITLDDKWTIITTDGSLSAHFEHTILITKKGAEILTA